MCLGILSMFNFWKWKKREPRRAPFLSWWNPDYSRRAELRSPSYLLKKFVSYTKHILRKNDEKIQNCLWKLPAPLSHPASTLSNYSFIHSNGKISSSKRIFFQTSFFTQTRFQFYSVAANMKNLRKGSEKGCLRLFLSLSSDKSFNWAHIFKIPAFFLHSRKKKIRSSNAATTFFLRFNVKIPAAPKKDLFLKNEDFFADIQLSRFWRENSLKFKNIYNISKCFCQQLPLTASVIFRVNGFPIWSYYIRMPDKKSLEMTPYLPKETVCQIADSCSLDDCHFDSGSFFEPEKQSK